jgi:diguanylate cyclase (GGDEF)-like protein/PAS domain S-box-containing protein
MGEAESTGATALRLLAPTRVNAPSEPMDSAKVEHGVPTSRRLREVLREHDVSGERAIALAQGAIALFILTLHIIAQISQRLDVPGADSGPFAGPLVSPWVVLILSMLVASSALRLYLVQAGRPPERALDVLNVADIAIFLSLIWGYQYVYGHPAGGVLKAPTQALLFAVVALRALRFHPRPVLTSGVVAVLGWTLLVCAAVIHDGRLGLTRDYADHLASYRIMIGAEVERVVALAALVAFLGVATHNARLLLSRSAHTSDYAEALAAARKHLEEATAARTRAEAALAELDRRDAELYQQNKRFDAALENMKQGICMYDSTQRLIVCNRRYAELYGLTPDQVKPGTTLRQVLAHRVAVGIYGCGSPDEYIRVRLARAAENRAATDVQELSDGRVVATVHQPTPDGGWVATLEDITELRRAEARLAYIARHDVLTDLPNRALLRERLAEALTPTHRSGGRLAVLLLNLDRFKDINDTLGHPVGDALLKRMGERLADCVDEGDTVAHLGGDEFAIIKFANDPAAEASELVKTINEAVSTPFALDEHHAVIATSIGIAVAPGDGGTADELLKNADLALYRAKSDGRGQHRFFEPEMDQRMQARLLLERYLRDALVEGQFQLFYQPLVNLESDQVVACEALLRWDHPVRGSVPPAEFVPLAEDTGLIVPISEWILRQACEEAARWPERIKVAVNISPVHLRAGSLVQTVVTALAAAGLPASRLELEITETALLQNSKEALSTLTRLHDLGVRLALDDFGTGYSSLSYLRSYPFDKIKIDRSFIADLGSGNHDSLAIVRSLTRLGASLGMATTAEGVETDEQLAVVRAEGVTEMQGYHFSPPRPAAEIRALLEAAGRERSASAA